jgi:hypothetical protein
MDAPFLKPGDITVMAKLFRQKSKVPSGPRTNGSPAPSSAAPLAAAHAAVTALEAALALELKAHVGKPHTDMSASLSRRHELAVAARLMLVYAERGRSLLALLMDFRDYTLSDASRK